MNKLHVLFVTDGNGYTAQCLQYDIAAQGDSIKDAKRAFEYAITAEVGYLASINKTLDDLPAAPQYYWDEFQQASLLAPISNTPLRVPAELSSLVSAVPEQESRVA